MQSHIRKVYACLAVTCHLHFWQNGRDLLSATAVTRGWNGYRNKNQHRKWTLVKKILPPFLQGFEPATFQSRVRALTTELSPPLHPARGGRPGLPVPSLTVLNMVSVDVKQHLKKKKQTIKARTLVSGMVAVLAATAERWWQFWQRQQNVRTRTTRGQRTTLITVGTRPLCLSKVLPKLQAQVYDILPLTTAVFSYAIGSRKLSAGAQTKVSLLQTTQIKEGVSFTAANKVYTSKNKNNRLNRDRTLSSFFTRGGSVSCLRAACLGAK